MSIGVPSSMALSDGQSPITREEFLRSLTAASGIAFTGMATAERASVSQTQTETGQAVTVVDFDWSYPRCPEEDVGQLDQYFFGDIDSSGGFHLDDGAEAAVQPDNCVLRTDADDALTTSLPGGNTKQAATLDHYPRRGETITFEHYMHGSGSNMEFRFGVQEDIRSHYAVRFETEKEEPAFYLLRSDEGTVTVLDEVSGLDYSPKKFHDFQIKWSSDDITVTLFQDDAGTRLSGDDDTYDSGGIAFYKEVSGGLFSNTNLWNTVKVAT